MKYINQKNFEKSLVNFKKNIPFDHCIIDDFFKSGVAEELEKEFLEFDSIKWHYYKSPIEDKKTLNDWNQFGELTYKVFQELMSDEFVEIIIKLLGANIYIDHGLHGGGLHMHGTGGNLNPHLDYSIHPKMGLLRKLNIIIYISNNLEKEHGGDLGLWTHSNVHNGPDKLIKEVQPTFNRAIMFDTTQNSWHGMSKPLVQPEGIYRKSLAIYYLTDLKKGDDPRQKALFAPRESQKNDKEIIDLIKKRASKNEFHTVYRTD